MTKHTQFEKIQPAAATAGSLSAADRLYLRFGWPMVKTLHTAVRLLAFGVVLVLDYLLVLFTAVNVIPNIAVLIQRGTGVSIDMRLDAVLAGWLIPVLFIVAAVFVGEIFLMRGLWRFAAAKVRTLGGWLFRLEEEKRSGQRSVSLLPSKSRAKASRGPKIAALS